AGANYPETFNDTIIQPMQGVSLANVINGTKIPSRSIYFSHQGARAVVKDNWKLVWGKRLGVKPYWELYDLSKDKCETNDVAKDNPDVVEVLSEEWKAYAKRTGLTK
ncbi:MAG: arylsulfatase, partial [Bacteroidales bacterium]|nr:arylsulfatase [Bacteroidales bacterium]